MMKLEAFKDNVDLYSADLSRWPVELVKPALALVEADDAARDYFEAAALAEDELRAYDPSPADTAALQNAILAAITADPAQNSGAENREAGQGSFSAHLAAAGAARRKTAGLKWKPAYLFAPGGGLLAAAILGFIIGVMPQGRSVSGGDYLVDPVYYAQDQILHSDSDLYNGGLF
jgi:hypothetical protein